MHLNKNSHSPSFRDLLDGDHLLTAAIAWVIFAGVCVVAASAWAAQ